MSVPAFVRWFGAGHLFERFEDEVYDGKRTLPEALWKAHSASLLGCPSLQICDLTDPQTLAALIVDYAALMNEKLEIPQEWGLAIQKHPLKFQGIKYKSRFNDRICLGIFDQDEIRSQLRIVRSLGPLEQHDPAGGWLDEYRIQLY
jgi:hypothetical protein